MAEPRNIRREIFEAMKEDHPVFEQVLCTSIPQPRLAQKEIGVQLTPTLSGRAHDDDNRGGLASLFQALQLQE